MSQGVSPKQCILIGCGEEVVDDPDGLCDAHSKLLKRRRRKQVGMTPAEIRQWLEKDADLKRVLADLGVSSIDELACARLSVSSGGTVIRREKLIDENDTFDEIFRGRDEY